MTVAAHLIVVRPSVAHHPPHHLLDREGERSRERKGALYGQREDESEEEEEWCSSITKGDVSRMTNR